MSPDIVRMTLAARGPVLLAGAPGSGKSTFAAALARGATDAGLRVACVGCDPGSPAFGVPGAVCSGEWDTAGWRLVDLEPLCTLDAVRFRLPLVEAVARLLARSAGDMERQVWLLDAPGTVRGTPGAELVTALAAAARADLVVLLERGPTNELDALLRALDVRVVSVPASEHAHSPSRRARARHRTALWDAYLNGGAYEQAFDVERLAIVGTPPQRAASGAWCGRQIALLRGRTCAAMGEIVALDGGVAHAKVRGAADGATALVLRDARRGSDGLLVTAEPFGRDVRYAGTDPERRPGRAAVTSAAGAGAARIDGGIDGGIGDGIDGGVDDEPRDADAARMPAAGRETSASQPATPVVRVGPFAATIVNGVFRDPLLLVRLRHRGRTLLFDLGETNRLGARVAHQVTDVFLSHAHIDHIAGFLWLLRSRIGETSTCRIFGPAGIAANVGGLVNGVHWDRAGEGAPRFAVTELHPDGRLLEFAIRAGDPLARLRGETVACDGVLLDEPLLRVRAVTLDHLTPVLAFALESAVEINVRKERLAALGLEPGPWLARLKDGIAAGRHDETIDLPDGTTRSVRELTGALVLLRDGTKLVYATDLADTAENRQRLAELAREADVLFCESTFRIADADRAARTGHLTTRACGEIAAAANVARLVPFHFSRRYETAPGDVYREVKAACPNAIVPRIGEV